MWRSLFCILAAVALSLKAQFCLGQSGNLLSNPGFEGAVKPDGLPESWVRAYGDKMSKWSVDETAAHSGRRSVRIEMPTVPPKDSAATVEQAVPVQAGRPYYCSAWCKGKPGAQGAIYIVWKTQGGDWLLARGTNFTYTADWKEAVVTDTAPPGSALGTARVDIRSPGTAWVDDVDMGLLAPARLAISMDSGKVRAGAVVPLTVTALDKWGSPLADARIEIRLETNGTARIVSLGQSNVMSGKIALGVSDARGMAHAVLKTSDQADKEDKLTCVAEGIGPEKAPSATLTTTANGAPTAYRVDLADEFPREAGGPVEVKAQLTGAYGEALSADGRLLRWSVTGDGKLHAAETKADESGTASNKLTPGKALSTAQVKVEDGSGIKGESEGLTVVPPQRPDNIRLAPNGYFVHADGTPFVPLGGVYANFVHEVKDGHVGQIISHSFSEVSDDQLRAWFAYLEGNGVTALRGMLRDHAKKGCEPLDIIGRVNGNLLDRWKHMMSLARPHGIRFLLTLHESWYAAYAAYHSAHCLEQMVLPYYSAQELQQLPPYRRRFLVEKRMVRQTTHMMSDPDVIACQRDYLREAMPRLVSIPDIFAYEIENEQCHGFLDWTSEQLRDVRAADRLTPLCVSPLGVMSIDSACWTRALDIDFFSPHAYPSDKRVEYALEVLVGAKYTGMFKPSFTGESEGFTDHFKSAPLQNQILGVRDIIWFQLASGGPGCFIWHADKDEVFAEFKMPKEIMATLDLANIRWARAPIGIDVSHEAKDDRFFLTAEGKALLAGMNEYTQWCLDHGLAFDFTFDNAGYATRLSARQFAKPEGQPGLLGSPPSGLQILYLASADGSCILAYARNFAGLQEISGLGYKKDSKALMRFRRPVDAKLSLRLPFQDGVATVWDLDARAMKTRPVTGRGDLLLSDGPTDHDFVIVIEKGKP